MKALVGASVGHYHQLAAVDGMPTKRTRTGALAQFPQAQVGLKPLPIAINEGHQRNGGATDMGRQINQIVVGGFKIRIEDVETQQRRLALSFVDRNRCGDHVRKTGVTSFTLR